MISDPLGSRRQDAIAPSKRRAGWRHEANSSMQNEVTFTADQGGLLKIRLLVVDDHEMVREGLRYAFGSTEIEVVEAVDGETALQLVVDQEFDAVLLDVEMPVLTGLQVLSRIKQQRPNLPVVMHSCHDGRAYVEQSMKLGAAGYILKSPDKNRVIEAVRVALAGGNAWISDQLQHATNGE